MGVERSARAEGKKKKRVSVRDGFWDSLNRKIRSAQQGLDKKEKKGGGVVPQRQGIK